MVVLTLNSHIPSPQHKQVTNEAAMKGLSWSMNRPHSSNYNDVCNIIIQSSHTINSSCALVAKDRYISRAVFSCSDPQEVAALVNFLSSGWHIVIMRLVDGEA